MECKHERIMCRNCVKICLDCGAELPKDFYPHKVEEVAEQPTEPKTKRTRKKVN